jgi:hypothetical protein
MKASGGKANPQAGERPEKQGVTTMRRFGARCASRRARAQNASRRK